MSQKQVECSARPPQRRTRCNSAARLPILVHDSPHRWRNELADFPIALPAPSPRICSCWRCTTGRQVSLSRHEGMVTYLAGRALGRRQAARSGEEIAAVRLARRCRVGTDDRLRKGAKGADACHVETGKSTARCAEGAASCSRRRRSTATLQRVSDWMRWRQKKARTVPAPSQRSSIEYAQ